MTADPFYAHLSKPFSFNLTAMQLGSFKKETLDSRQGKVMFFVLGALLEIGSTFQSGNEGNLVCKGTMGRDIFGICWNRIPVT